MPGNRTWAAMWSIGFGAVSSETVTGWTVPGAGGLIAIVCVSNLPQLLLSYLYISYNNLFTCMLLADEWSGFSHQRKTLRVTSAKGHQRSTYWLQLPYRYGAPLLIFSGCLHWLVSQTLFLARLNAVDPHGIKDENESFSTLGYSPIAMVFVIILGGLLVILGIGLGFRRYRAGMPLVSSCSAAISAACHPPEADGDASSKAVLFGVVDAGSDNVKGREEPVGHCSFTSFEVEPLVEGLHYA